MGVVVPHERLASHTYKPYYTRKLKYDQVDGSRFAVFPAYGTMAFPEEYVEKIVDARLTACPETLQLMRFSWPRKHIGE